MFHQTPLKSATCLALLAAGIGYALVAGYFGLELLAELAILAILAISLDLVAGYGGMVSLCHGALFGVGAYAFAGVTVLGDAPAIAALPVAIGLAAALAWAIGAVTARTHGIFFIMATLAFGQMAYEFVFQSPHFGGDDGMAGIPRFDLGWLGLSLDGGQSFAIFCVVMATLAYAVAAGVLRSGFGRTLVGIRENEGRMRAMGLNIWRAKARAFAISGALAGFAGALAAQHSMFVSPGLMNWTTSGEVLVVVILGGIGTLTGAVIGAMVFIILKHQFSPLVQDGVHWLLTEIGVDAARKADHWHIIVGLVLIAAVLSGGRGIFGQIEYWITRRA